MAGYWEMLRSRYAARLLVGTLIGRLPNATAALAIVLFARAEGGSYSLAGVLAAVYGLATAVGQPALGRLVDLYGQLVVMLPAAVVSALGTGLLVAVGVEPVALAYLGVLVAGVCTPPLEGGLRALWPDVLGPGEKVHAAYALDAVAQEVMFTVGPLLVTLLVGLWNPGAALLVINALGVLGALSVVVSRPSRAWRSAPRTAHWLGALRSPGLLVLLGAFFFVGLALGSIAVDAVAYADEVGEERVSSYLLAANGGGALLGGLVYGSRQWPGLPETRQRWLAAALAVGYLPLALTPGVGAMTFLALVAGISLAPSLACAFVVVDRHAPSGTVTEAFSWLVTTFGVGAAVGTAVAGPAVELGGVAAGFGVAGVAGVAAFVVLAMTRRWLMPREVVTPAATLAAAGENDRNGAPEPGFRSRHQA